MSRTKESFAASMNSMQYLTFLHPFNLTPQIIEAISTHKKITKSDATLYVKQLQQNGKYVQELWSIA